MKVIAAAGAACLSVGGLCAAETNEVPSIVVEASRLGKTAMEMPQSVETVTRAAIAASGAHDASSLLERSTGVQVRRLGGGNPALAQIAMRGYGENSHGRALLIVDGERLNNPDMSSPNLSRVSLDSVERIEVLHGPQTVLHGDNASAGVINIVTEPVSYERKTALSLQGGSYGTIGGDFSTKGGFADERLAYWGGAGWLRSEGWRDHSGYELWNANGGVRRDWENGSWLRASMFYSDSQYDLPGGLTRDQWKHDRRMSATPEDHARLHSEGLNLSGRGVFNDENELRIESSASYRSVYSHFEGGDKPYVWREHQEDSIYSYSFSPQWINTSRIGDFDNEFALGGDLRYDTLNGVTRYTGSYADYSKPDYSRWTAGAFLRDEFFLTDEFSIVGGARLQRAMARNELADKSARNDNLAAYEAAANWRPTDGTKLFARWCRFFRNPFLDETPWYTNPGGAYVPKNILTPERGYSTDFGGAWKSRDGFDVDGSLFVSETSREVFYDAGKYANVNSDSDVLRQGVQGSAGWEKDKLAGVHLRYALTYAKFEEGDYDSKYVPLVPMHQVRLDGRIWIWDECFVRGGYRYCSKQVSCSDFANDYERVAAYGLFDLGLQYAPVSHGLEGLTFSFDVDNLLDKHYVAYSTYGSSFYPGAGVCCMFRIRYEF